MNTTPKMGLTEWLMLLGLSILWGGSFFFSKIAIAEMSPTLLVFFRVAIAAVILFFYLVFTKRSLPSGSKVWGAFFLMGLINNVIPFTLLFWGQTEIASSLASILNATTPIFTIILAHVFTADEKINVRSVLGIILGFLGVATMLGLFSGFDQANSRLHMLACVGAAISYGFASVFGRQFKKMDIGPVRTSFGQLAASSVIMLLIVSAIDTPPDFGSLSSATIWSVLALAIFSTAFAYLLFFRILAVGGATNISLVTLLVPVSAILLGTIILGENLSAQEVVGMCLIGLGLLAIDGRVFNYFSKITP